MKINKFSKKPLDAIDRTNKDLVISYPVDKKKNNNLKIIAKNPPKTRVLMREINVAIKVSNIFLKLYNIKEKRRKKFLFYSYQ